MSQNDFADGAFANLEGVYFPGIGRVTYGTPLRCQAGRSFRPL